MFIEYLSHIEAFQILCIYYLIKSSQQLCFKWGNNIKKLSKLLKVIQMVRGWVGSWIKTDWALRH